MKSIQSLRQERDTVAKAYRNEIDKAGDKFTKEAETACDGFRAQIERIDAQISAIQNVLSVEEAAEVDANNPDRVHNPGNDSRSKTAPGEEALTVAFDAFLRGGTNAVYRLDDSVKDAYNKAVQNAQGTGTDAAGGALVPTTFADALLEKITENSDLRQFADVLKSDSVASVSYPKWDGSGETGEWLDENIQAADGDAVFGTVPISMYKVSSKVIKMPLEILMGTNIGDLEDRITAQLGRRIERTSNQGYTTGDGVAKPNGYMNIATVGVTGALTAGISYDEIVDLFKSVPRHERKLGNWMMSDALETILMKLKDADGRPLWVPGITSETPAEILGKAYGINDDQAAPAANAKPLAFGNFKSLMIRDTSQVILRRFDDSAYATKGQVGFMAITFTGSALLSAGGDAIKTFQHAAV